MGGVAKTLNSLISSGANLASTVSDFYNPATTMNNITDTIGSAIGANATGRFEGGFDYGQAAAGGAPSVADLSPTITQENEYEQIKVPNKPFLTINEQKELAAYGLYSVPKFYIPPILLVNEKGATSQLNGGGNTVRCFIFVSVGDLKIEDTTYPRNVPILKVPDADIDAVQDLGFGSGTIKASGRLWGEAGYARLRTLREICKSRRTLIWSAQETGAWLVFPQNVPGINTNASQPGQYFFEVTFVCVGKISETDPMVKAALDARTSLVKSKFKREMAILTSSRQFKEFSGQGSGFFWDPLTEQMISGDAEYGGDVGDLSSFYKIFGTTSGEGGIPTTNADGGVSSGGGGGASWDAVESKNTVAKDGGGASWDAPVASNNPSPQPPLIPSQAVVTPTNTSGNAATDSGNKKLDQSSGFGWFKYTPIIVGDNVTINVEFVKISESDSAIFKANTLPEPTVIGVPFLTTASNPKPSTVSPIQLLPNPDVAILDKRQYNRILAWRYVNKGGRIEINNKTINQISSQELFSHRERFITQSQKHFDIASAFQRNPQLHILEQGLKVQNEKAVANTYQKAADVLGKELIFRAPLNTVAPNALAFTQPFSIDMQSGVVVFFNGQSFKQIQDDILQAYKQKSQINLNESVQAYNLAVKKGAMVDAGNIMEDIRKFESAINVIDVEFARRSLDNLSIADTIIGGDVKQFVASSTLIAMNAQAGSKYGLLGSTPFNLNAGSRLGGLSGAMAMSDTRRPWTPEQVSTPATGTDTANYRFEFMRIQKGKEKVVK